MPYLPSKMSPQAITAAVTQTLAARFDALATALGWTTMGSFSPKLTPDAPELYLIYEGTGSLRDVDQDLLRLSGTHEIDISVIDLSHELAQAYACGDYDSGSIAFPDQRATYAAYVRRLEARIEALR